MSETLSTKMLSNLISKGYFPKELPPPFSSIILASRIQRELDSLPDVFQKPVKPARLCLHNLARVGTLWRALGIPNPIYQFRIAKEVAENWKEITALISESPLSLTKPQADPLAIRALTRSTPFESIPLHRARVRATGKYLLRADISRFYHAIYTHSIPWAAHGKEVAKVQRGQNLFGNRLDKAVREGQDGQTLGIPVGPDTSLVISELILSRVDMRICRALRIIGFRYVDDYECVFKSRADAETAKSVLQEALAEYELSLNPDKTEIVELPDSLEKPWVSRIRCFGINDSGKKQLFDLVAFFDEALAQSRENRKDSILKYALSRLFSTDIEQSNWPFLQDIILQCIVNEPGTLPVSIRLLMKHKKAGRTIDRDKLQESLNLVMERHSQAQHASEVAWAIWGSILFNLPIEDNSARQTGEMPDSIVALTALDARERGIIKGHISFPLWESYATPENLFNSAWLLVYESTRRKWLEPCGGEDLVGADPGFSFLDARGVSFYRSVEPEILTETHAFSIPEWITAGTEYR